MLIVVVGLGDASSARTSRAASARRGRLGAGLRQQLVADLPRRLLLRPLRPAVAARTTSGRSSVEEQFYIVWPFLLLLGVALRARAPSAAPGCARGWPRRRSVLAAGLGDPDGGPLRARRSTPRGSTTAPTPAPSSCCRRGAGDGLAEPPAGRRDRRRSARRSLDGAGRRRPGGDRAADLADRLVLRLPLPRRLRPALGGDRAGGRRARPPGHAGSGPSSAGSRCAGSACAPTGSTSGTSR